jgi:hypothetical protein
MSKRIRVCKTEFVEVTDLVPKQWGSWFYECISNNAPFSWGDNNRSMVTAECFARHCEDRLDDVPTTQGAIREWFKKVYGLGQMYIDLEN